MIELLSDKFIKYHSLYHKLMYSLMLFLTIMLRLLKMLDNTTVVVILCAMISVFGITDAVLMRLEHPKAANIYVTFKMIELISYNVVQAAMPFNELLMVSLVTLTIILSFEMIIHGSDYDRGTVFLRKLIALAPIVVNLAISAGTRSESLWLCCLLVQVTAMVIVFLIVDWVVTLSDSYNKIISKLRIEKFDVERVNSKLIEYQDIIKTINEQINYQKIDMIRTNRELEQANIEIESQNEVMKYMASTFDVMKCIDVITDAIMNVKKPKMCAFYIDKDVYMNKYGSCIIKTNYTSMERRLKKEVEGIYESIVKNNSHARVITGAQLKNYKFIGDANINSLAILPLDDGGTVYGIMIVGSDDSTFFEKGLKYYEACIVEFNVSIKSTKMYLRMEDMARKDGLTGIYNRIYFNELFAKAASEAADRKKPISVALFDIDKFKNVNDTYGHIAGDLVIKMVASIAEKYAQKYKGFAGRYGGEEFLIVLPGYNSDATLKILEQMHDEIRNTVVEYEDEKIKVNVCIGLSSYPDLCDDVKMLVNRADKAMYYGKRNGRGRLVLDCPKIDEEV